jgi:hypothetical protein
MVGGLELGRRDLATGSVEPAGVPERDPVRGRELDLLDRPPGPATVDEFGLVQAVDGLGESVVVRVAPAPDRADGLGLARRSV